MPAGGVNVGPRMGRQPPSTRPVFSSAQGASFCSVSLPGKRLLCFLSRRPARALRENPLRQGHRGRARPQARRPPEYLLAKKSLCCMSAWALDSRLAADSRAWKRFSTTQDDRLTKTPPRTRSRPAPPGANSLSSFSPGDSNRNGTLQPFSQPRVYDGKKIPPWKK